MCSGTQLQYDLCRLIAYIGLSKGRYKAVRYADICILHNRNMGME